MRLQFSEIGAPIEGDPTNGFGESAAVLHVADTNSIGADFVRLDWSRDKLSTGRSFGAALCDFWAGRGMSHDEALELGRSLLARLFGHGNLKTIWEKARTRFPRDAHPLPGRSRSQDGDAPAERPAAHRLGQPGRNQPAGARC
ncbi:MAG: hypothetical protein IPI49_22415 [Myxococcales bacterium]|nr:hypothetical protein [Myxococcales bacterium]